MNLHKTIPVITDEEQNSWSQHEVLKCLETSSVDENVEVRCSAKYAKITVFLLLSFFRSRFLSRFTCFLCLLTDIYIPLPKIHNIDSSRRFLPHVQNARSQNAREASINRYGAM